MKLILVSESPRRRDLLRRLHFRFSILKPKVKYEEVLTDPKETVILNAKRKALSVLEDAPADSILIGVDTIVYLNQKILGKPYDVESAYNMLRELSGRWHYVYSGLYIYDITRRKDIYDISETRVKFKELTDEEIKWYINTSEPFDKAGGYGIQGFASLFIEEIIGCYYNVVGFPISLLYKLLLNLGYNPLSFINTSNRP